MRLSKDDFQRWLKNLVFFTAPALAIFFLQMSQGVAWKEAILVALLALYGVIADYFKKLTAAQ